MTVLSAQSIQRRVDIGLGEFALGIEPFEPMKKIYDGLSYGLTAAGYDIRAGDLTDLSEKLESITLKPGDFRLIASLEHIKVPPDLQVIVHDKSTWARRGLAIQNTVLEPGWKGWVTLELSNHGTRKLCIRRGVPIAQLIFHQLDAPTDRPYTGKYQNQSSEPVGDLHELTGGYNATT